MLIFTGISIELTTKEKSSIKIDIVIEIFQAFIRRIQKKNEF